MLHFIKKKVVATQPDPVF